MPLSCFFKDSSGLLVLKNALKNIQDSSTLPNKKMESLTNLLQSLAAKYIQLQIKGDVNLQVAVLFLVADTYYELGFLALSKDDKEAAWDAYNQARNSLGKILSLEQGEETQLNKAIIANYNTRSLSDVNEAMNLLDTHLKAPLEETVASMSTHRIRPN